MELPRFFIENIPENCFVIRVKNTNHYIHIENNYKLILKSKMMGCLVMSKESAEIIIQKIMFMDAEVFRDEVVTQYEYVPFKEAYDMHGFVEKQIICN
jgi:hypothetical protein